MPARPRGLSGAHVDELVRELRPRVVGRRVREIQPLPPRDVLLILEPVPTGSPDAGSSAGAPAPARRLRLSADPRAARVHLQVGRVRRHAGPPGPFYRRLAERLTGLSLQDLEQVGSDRVVRLAFGGASGPSAVLILELFGRHANLILLEGDGRIVTGLSRPAPDSPAAERLAAGRTYEPPEGRPPAPAGLPLAEALPDPPPPEVGAAGDRARAELARLAPLSWRVEASLGSDAEEHHEGLEKGELRRRLLRAEKGARQLLAGLEQRRRAADEAERVRMDAELLTAHLGGLKRGMRELEVEDSHLEGAPRRRIPLDPGLSPRRNAERLFSRYKKLKRSAERVPEELALARTRLEELLALRERLEDGAEAAPELEREAISRGLLRPRQAPPERRRVEPRRPYHRFRTRRGLEVRVGRSARDNDELTFRQARGNDLWLHTADAPGSHVVLRLERGSEPDPEDVLDAALLAIHYSPLRGTRRADVHVARCKEVKKPRRAPAGLVTLSGGRIRSVRTDAERLEGLLASRRSGSGAPDGDSRP